MQTLLASAARTASGTASLTIAHIDRILAALFFLDVTVAATAAADTLDVYLQASPDGGTTWDDVVHFTQVLGNGGAKQFIATWQRNVTPEAELQAPQDVAMAAGVRQGPVFDLATEVGRRERHQSKLHLLGDDGRNSRTVTHGVDLQRQRDQLHWVHGGQAERRALADPRHGEPVGLRGRRDRCGVVGQWSNVYQAAAMLAELVIGSGSGSGSGVQSKKVGDTTITYYQRMIPSWRSRGLAHQTVSVGGISAADKDVIEDDSDAVAPAFRRGQHEQEGGRAVNPGADRC